jgi:hypothetical protein
VQTVSVGSVGEFEAAVSAFAQSGGTIVLRPGAYSELVVPPRAPRLLQIVGRPGVRVGRLMLERTEHVSVGPLRIGPVGEDAWLDADFSSHVDLHDLVVSARGTRLSAQLFTDGASGLVIRRSEFTHCGDRSPAFVNCLLLRNNPTHVTIENSWFHDCLGCDFIHGWAGYDFTLRNSRLERTLPCHIGRIRCMHQDLIELFGGSHLLFEDNHFGLYERGGAQLYMTNAVNHVLIENNLFTGTDPRVPGWHSRIGLVIGARGSDVVPHYVVVANNTILTGARREDGYLGSVRVASRYPKFPRSQRVIFVNNVIAYLEDEWPVCPATRLFSSNVIEHGVACSSGHAHGNVVGDAALDAAGRPTADSTLLIDHASRRYAPKTDITGRPRGANPDIGAYEYRG